MKNLFLLTLLSIQLSYATTLTCDEKFPKPLDEGCKFERCSIRIMPKLVKDAPIYESPSTKAKIIQQLTKKNVISKIIEFKYQWIKAGTLKALKSYTSEDGKYQWKQDDIIPFVVQGSEEEESYACVGKKRIEFTCCHVSTVAECEFINPCLTKIEYPKYIVWGKIELKTGKVGWINTDNLEIGD